MRTVTYAQGYISRDALALAWSGPLPVIRALKQQFLQSIRSNYELRPGERIVFRIEGRDEFGIAFIAEVQQP
jgi:hypothetical protein